MSGYEFAIPKSAIGGFPRILVWEDSDLIRIVVSSADAALEVQPKPVAVADPSGSQVDLTHKASNAAANTATLALAPGSWSSGGVHLPPGTELSFVYDDATYFGTIDDGEIVFDEARSKSPSGAVMAAINARTGKVVNVNGWNYIDVTLQGDDEPVSLGSLRSSVLKRTR